MIFILVSTSAMATQVCEDVVSCPLVRSKLTEQEKQCFYRKPKVRTIVKTVVVEKLVDRIVYVDRPAEKSVVVNQIMMNNREPSSERHVEKSGNRNSISLLGLATPTRLITEDSGSSYKAYTKYQADVGLMYQRDLSQSIRGSIGASIRGNALLGLGYNF